MRKIDEDQILKRNPQINPKRVAHFQTFYQIIEQAGVDVAPRYRISPPLGVLVKQSSQRLGGRASGNR